MALVNCEPTRYKIATWGKGSNAPREVREIERELEQAVSEYIGRMTILWIAVPDEPGPKSDRGFIERNAIALLANGSGQEPSATWLGRYSAREPIRKSGLWNVNHVDGDFDPKFLGVFARYVQAFR
jgi:hypothetical protein